jgi:anti-sigma-K factor RskA
MKDTRHERTTACYRFGLELEAYLEGENRPFALAHTRECVSCRVVLEDLEALRAATRELPREEPSPAVWSNIRAQLAAEGAFAEKAGAWDWIWQLDFLRRPIPVAAFACLVALGCLFTAPRNYPKQEVASAIASPAGGTTVRTMAFLGDGGALEQVVRELEKTFKAREGSLAPDVKATYENSLISLDTSIRECNDSLQREPGNSLAHEYLLAAYSQKAEVLSSALEFDEGR